MAALLALATIIMCALKAFGCITLSWWWCAAPLIAAILLMFGIWLIAMGGVVLVALFKDR